MKKISISGYKKNIFRLFTGTSISQIIPLVSSPLLTRLYSPADFGIYATFLAFSALLSIAATLRYEMAILIPEDNNKADDLLKLILITSVCFSILIQIIAFVLTFLFNINFQLGNFIYFLSISVLVNAFYNGMYYINLRKKNFKLLAKIRIFYALIVLLISIIIPFLTKGSIGLILATMIAYAVCAMALFKYSYSKIPRINIENIKKIFYEFKNFPLFDLPSAFLTQLSNRLPIILLSNYFPINTIGYYSLSQRMIDFPTSFVTSAISDTFKQKAADDYNKHGNCISVFYETRKLLFFIAIIPYIIIQFFAPQLFQFIFGNNWLVAGEYSQILAFMFFLRFILGPLSYTFYIRNKMKFNMIGQFIKFIISIFALLIGVYFANIKLGLMLFAFGNCIIYLFYYYYSRKFAQ